MLLPLRVLGMMSGKPEQQPIQNVVVYVSTGDNFAHTYSVGQQNVAFQHPQNGGFASATPITCKKSGLKAEFVNGSTNPGGLYTPPTVQPNGYPGGNLAYGGNSAAATTILKNLGGQMCGLESIAGSVEEQLCSYAASQSLAHPRICGPAYIDKGGRGTSASDAEVIQGNYVATVTVDPSRGHSTGGVSGEVVAAAASRGFVTLCGESSPTLGTANLLPPGPRASSRCDSARSEAAESSCSSLSSDGQPEVGNNPMVQTPASGTTHHTHQVVCRTGQVALATAGGQILLQGSPHGIAQLPSTSAASGQPGLHFSAPQSAHHPHSHQPHPEVQSYITCPSGGVVLGNQTVVLNGQQTLGGAAGAHSGQQPIGNLVLTMTVPQLVSTGGLSSGVPGGQVLQAFTTVGSLASTATLAPTATLAQTASLPHNGPLPQINSQSLLSVGSVHHPSTIPTPPIGVTTPVVNSSVVESTAAVSVPFGWKRILSGGSIIYVR
ncbi:hypothetical protein J437_LFUL007882 [Ladona fulva]|uniref:Uncharacterized protein n=1 Tax=Ladona fulva TaxID=123851 RepID=A0A8K0K2C0_LADFU|nr:hypothetical protein J437_LFUL007882 [Ladona fulva]